MGLDYLIWFISASGAAAGATGGLLWAIYARCFVPVPPNRALVLYGGRSRRARSDPGVAPPDVDVQHPRIVVGGGVFVAPWNKGVGRLSLDPVPLDLSVRSLHVMAGSRTAGWEVRLQVRARIPAEPGSLTRAAENLLGKTDEEVRTLLQRTVEGAVPSVLSRVRDDEGDPDWDRLAAEIQAGVAPELVPWGFVVQTLSVTELRHILPADLATSFPPAKPVSWEGSPAGDRAQVAAWWSGVESRLARTERNLATLGGLMARMRQESAAAGERATPVSVLDLPLGWEAPAGVVSTEDPLRSYHESMEGGRSPPLHRLSADDAVVEGG